MLRRMSAADEVRRCPVCDSPDAFLVLDRFGRKTFFCTNCEYDWEERESDKPDEPPDDAPGP